jgi:hypothetical protein
LETDWVEADGANPAYSDDADHDSDSMAITIPSDADRRRSEATLSYYYHL